MNVLDGIRANAVFVYTQTEYFIAMNSMSEKRRQEQIEKDLRCGNTTATPCLCTFDSRRKAESKSNERGMK